MIGCFGVTDDCINIHSYGEICVWCGCCSRNKNYADRVHRILEYYKDRLWFEYRFDEWSDDDLIRRVQEKNVRSNIQYYKRKIRLYKKIVRTVRK